MSQKRSDNEKSPFLDDEEKNLVEAMETALEDGSLVSTLSPERKAELQTSARATFNPKRKSVTTRLPERDLLRLKAKALQEGVPYQTLLASIVHQFVEGTLVRKP